MEQVLAMKREDRTAFLHGLCMHLNKQNDIACFSFYERETIREMLEEKLDKKVAEDDLDGTMVTMDMEWLEDNWEDFNKMTILASDSYSIFTFKK
jgi:hypothetical protein